MGRKKIILVAGSIFPEASATGNICYQIAKDLNKKYDVHIISLLNKYICEKEVVTPEGIRISVERTPWFSLRQRFLSRNNKIGFNIVRAIDRIFTLICVPKNTWWYTKRVKKMICAESKRESDLCVISFSEPFEAHWGVLKARKKNSNFKWISIFEDSFAVPLHKKNLFISLSKMAQMEQSIIKNADHVFVTPEILSNRDAFYKGFETKVYELPYLIKYNVRENENISDGQIRMVYAGRFYRDIRPPEPMLDFFASLQIPDAVLDLFTAGDCENTIKKYSDSCDGIRLQNMITQEQLFEEYAKSDILINMENNIKEYKPSKQYEYIGTGKPIISFYYFEPDKNLEKYPLALQINVNNRLENIESAKAFVQKVKGKTMTPDEIVAIYPENTMQYVVSLIEKRIED